MAFGTFLWASIAVLGLTTLLTAYAEVLTVIKVVGGCYLIRFGYKSLKSACTPGKVEVNKNSTDQPKLNYFLRGLTVQITNPKAAMAMTAIVTIGMQGQAPVWVNVVLVLGISVISVVGHLLYAVAFSTQTAVKLYASSRQWVEASLGTFFCFAGFKLLSDRP